MHKEPIADHLVELNWLQRRIVVYSIIYYCYDDNAISDHDYDAMCLRLAEIQSTIADAHLSRLWYVFYDFDKDCTSGFNLINRLTREDRAYLKEIAWLVLTHKKSR